MSLGCLWQPGWEQHATATSFDLMTTCGGRTRIVVSDRKDRDIPNGNHLFDWKFIRQKKAYSERVAVISAKNHKRQRRKRQSVTAKREKSQTPKFV